VKCNAAFGGTSFEDEASARVDAERFVRDCEPKTEDRRWLGLRRLGLIWKGVEGDAERAMGQKSGKFPGVHLHVA
jgi:hypothetical protein